MNLFAKSTLLILSLISFISITCQSRLPSGHTTPPKYLITPSDVDEVLSKIIKTDDKIAMFSDFDGTLSDINSDSTLTKIRPEAKTALQELAIRSNFVVGIISGRQIDDVKKRVNIANITYSGNHGMEILFSNNTAFHYPISPEMCKNVTKIKTVIKEEYVDVYGGRLEDKNISLVYHYRSVNESLQQRVAAEVSDVVREFGLNPMPAHYAIEIKPPVVWTKGHAAKLILTEIYGSDWSKKARVFYMGDDTSDEDVMRMLKGKAITFRITADPNLKSYATYKIKSVDTAVFILEWLVNNALFD